MKKNFLQLWVLKDILMMILLIIIESLLFGIMGSMDRREIIVFQICLAVIVMMNVLISILFYRRFKQHCTVLPMENSTAKGTVFERFDNLLFETSKSGSNEYVAQALRTQAEIHALQNQINPHFLYNTLDIIRSQAISYNVPDIEKLTEALALLFRYSINSPSELVTLRDELNNVERYILIQQYRFRNRFDYEKSIEGSELLDYQLPLLTLQPIVENAIHHGLEHLLSKGKLTVRAFSTEKNIIIRVEDTGIGMDIQDLYILRERINNSQTAAKYDDTFGSSGIALYNVNQRIKLYFGNNYGLHITSIKDSGTTVEIVLPKIIRNGESGRGQ